MRWKISYDPHAVGTDRGDPRDAGEAYACQRVPVLLSYRIMNDEINHQPHYGRWFSYEKMIAYPPPVCYNIHSE